MARTKSDTKELNKQIIETCELFLKDNGREPNVIEVSKMCNMSNSTTGPVVTSWKNARAAAAQVINLSDDILEKLDEGRQFNETLVREVCAQKDRERETAVNAKETEIIQKYKEELDSALFDNDLLTGQIASQQTTINNLTKEIEDLKTQLLGETTDLKLLIKTLQQQMLGTLTDKKETDLQKAA